MSQAKTLLYFGALLHDVGKIVYRGSAERKTHSKLGYDFIMNEVAPGNEWFMGEDGRLVAQQVRYHHAKDIQSAPELPSDSLAFITYFADNVSAGMDRKDEGDEAHAAYFDRTVKLRKIFNILNGHSDDNTVEHADYNVIREDIKRGLRGTAISPREVDSLLNLLEATAGDIPSSTNRAELVDVSLYDHAKTTAGIAACIYEYLTDRSVVDYRAALFDPRSSAKYYAEPMFLLYSCDMSGIQDFIYNISGSGALKQLRARSLYLEMLLEHVVDELLARLELSRANLLYTGGGHAYLLLPNTPSVVDCLKRFGDELGSWFVEHYRTDLYLASAWVACSADDLANRGDDKQRYPKLYRSLSRQLSEAKAARYGAPVIEELNFGTVPDHDHSRECTECHRSDIAIDAQGKCTLCSSLGQVSRELIDKDVFVVLPKGSCESGALALPFGCELVMYARDAYLSKSPDAVRVYTKNSWDMGTGLATHIWMGDYTADMGGEGIAAYATQGSTLQLDLGIRRLGVVRADVDDLGSTFVSGLPAAKVSISRTSTLSRALSRFFKHEINGILQKGDYRVQIIYSGGDDLFIIGNWSDVLYASADIRRALDEYTGNGSLTLSAGIGMFDAKYPIACMAQETGELESEAKLYVRETGSKKPKDAIALWSSDAVFGWDEFLQVVMPRMDEVREAFGHNEKGKAFIYRLIALLRDIDSQVSIPRLAYLLARSFEDDEKNGAMWTKRFYEWALDAKERRCLVAALEWYVYSIREGN